MACSDGLLGARHLRLLSLAALTGCGGGDMGADAASEDALVCRTGADCDDGTFCNGTEECLPRDPAADARGCVPARTSPCDAAGERCSEDDDACVTSCDESPDADGDGRRAVECGGDDCDDGDPNAFPGNLEVCDVEMHDEDCDRSTFGVRDGDRDFEPDARCCNVADGGSVSCGTDCDDARADVHPGAPEVCDGRDNDCDGDTDEGVQRSFWPDADGDLRGDEAAPAVMACDPPAGHVENAGDCDDGNAAAHSRTTPELCDGMDNDCDSAVDEDTMEVDWYVDSDGDTFGDPASSAMRSCAMITGRAPNADDCDDGDPTVHPLASEVCDGVDNNCNGDGDEAALRTSCWPDADTDTFAPAGSTPTSACSCGIGTTARDPAAGADCDDGDGSIHPGATELCDRIDSDCSAGGGVEAGEDADGDMHTSITYTLCSTGFPKDDCLDSSPDVHPGQTGWFGRGYCTAPFGTMCECTTPSGNEFWCSSSTCPLTPLPCGSPFRRASFDYDCDTAEEPRAPMCLSGPCSTGGEPCGQDGFAVTTERCGQWMEYTNCDCTRLPGPVFECTAMPWSAPMPVECH